MLRGDFDLALETAATFSNNKDIGCQNESQKEQLGTKSG
jgi:hypothetical protein